MRLAPWHWTCRNDGAMVLAVQEGQLATEEESNPWAHCQVMWGNLLYEASQIYAAAPAARLAGDLGLGRRAIPECRMPRA